MRYPLSFPLSPGKEKLETIDLMRITEMNGTTYRVLIDGRAGEKQDILRVRAELARFFKTSTPAMDKLT